MADGATLKEGWFERPLASSHRICIVVVPVRFLEAVSFFQSNRSWSPQKKTKFLYKSSPGFEPTTFLIHDLSN